MPHSVTDSNSSIAPQVAQALSSISAEGVQGHFPEQRLAIESAQAQARNLSAVLRF